MTDDAERRLQQVEEALAIRRPEGRLFRRDGGPTPLLVAWCDAIGVCHLWLSRGDAYFMVRRSHREAQLRRKRAA